LVFSGCLQALLGVSLLASGVELRLFDHVYRFADVQGSFANRNHLAAYLVMCLAVGIGLMLSRFEEAGTPTTPTRRARLFAALQFLLSPGMLLRLLLVLMVVALVLTRSRMGNASFFVALLLVGLLALWAWRRMAPVTLALIASLLLIDVVLIGHWIGLDRVVQRMEQTALLKEDRRGEETFEERQIASTLGLQAVRDYPWVGAGAGSFEAVFPRYREPGIQGLYQHAHNDYLEIASDTGVLGLVLLAGVVLTSAARALRVLRTHGSRLARGVAFASLMSIVAMAVHVSVEFNLQIPAVALTFCVMLALAWVADGLPARLPARQTTNNQRTERSLPK
jgi:O-antigen ligase